MNYVTDHKKGTLNEPRQLNSEKKIKKLLHNLEDDETSAPISILEN